MAENKTEKNINLQPQSLEAEEAVLGAMMIDDAAANKAIGLLKSSHYFYKEAHKKIFEAMLILSEESNPIDTVSVSNELKKKKSLKSVGGLYYLTGLVDKVPTAANIETYASIVKEKGILRDLISASHYMSKKAFESGEDVATILDEAEQSIFSLTQQKDNKLFQHIQPILTQAIQNLEKMQSKKGAVVGIPSGIIDLDNVTAGFRKSDLIVIAGRPSMGKTALALSIARNAALESKVPTAIFSLEMSSDQLAQRLLSSEARIDGQKARTGRLQTARWKDVVIASGKLADAPLFIDDTAALSILDLRSRARRLKREENIGLLVVDYLQLMQGPRRSENRQQEISYITQSLKALAKELDIPVIALSQLSRAVESRTNKRPVLSDLRESGAIEQDADLVIFLYRPFVYDDKKVEEKGLAYLIVAKQRSGPTRTVKATFIDTYARFENYTDWSESENVS
ncbi:MAG: replicative DNA helicase [Candidatus Neomarinimicrobiota bacterium]|jgi:replicative DNA helicase|uniref:DNA 5'-3' helicase n=1 Tax=marine metagenome TaxID=408172 RepID=A0A381PXW0_9ZZZZ|nr:replicative DNA helicase [Candidatus Neomarinimicrobiota bacterium]|tara:strand:+ start:336 stop:1703 length:1368 start_codon:yes stop_codon:yes gene_type:complete